MLKQLRIRFVCITMSLVTVMLCVILGMVIHFTGQSIAAQNLRTMQKLTMAPDVPGQNRERAQPPHLLVRIDREGNISVAGGDSDILEEESLIPQITALALAQEGPSGILEEYDLQFWKESHPGGIRIVFADISNERSVMVNLVKVCIFIGTVSFFAFLVISMLLAKWAIRPVEEAWDQQKQFIADASHELKTPLTVIITNAELLQGKTLPSSEERQFSEGILTMTRQMRTLVEGMLELARADNGSIKTGFAQVDMSQLASQEVLSFETLFFESGRMLLCDIQSGIALRGSDSHLRQVLGILLDNAIKYSSPDSQVQLTLRRQGRECLLSVASPGGPISREDLKNIFKRFYRVDKARSRDGSYGLGLSIAQRIVLEHGGKIWAESANGSNTFFVQLPLNG